MARLLAMVLRTRADRPASPQRFEGADPLSCASDGCRPAGSALPCGFAWAVAARCVDPVPSGCA